MQARPDKDALRALLDAQVQQKLQDDPNAVTTYAAKPEPERKPYTSKPTVQEKAFSRELEQMRAEVETGQHRNSESAQVEEDLGLTLDDFPGLKEAARPLRR